jgi:hypothetical protein
VRKKDVACPLHIITSNLLWCGSTHNKVFVLSPQHGALESPNRSLTYDRIRYNDSALYQVRGLATKGSDAQFAYVRRA